MGSDDELCATITVHALERARTLCRSAHSNDRQVQFELLDLVHNVPTWLAGRVPPDERPLDLLVAHATGAHARAWLRKQLVAAQRRDLASLLCGAGDVQHVSIDPADQ